MPKLTQKELEVIIGYLRKFDNIEEALLFGSRVLDRNRSNSDIDIALKGTNIENSKTALWGLLEDESPLQYTFDIVDYHKIKNSDLKTHIDKQGIVFYRSSIVKK
ncbi:MAG: nucleotidyltransferase domain-containing protein [Oligoflexia bacterium]|nr:nucleotidyltransferase domain-containing protein [Oligoflexia bacterium]